MPVNTPNAPTLIPSTKSALGVSIKDAANRMRATNSKDVGPANARLWSSASDAFGSIQRQLDQIYRALQSELPSSNPIQVVDANGALIAELGDMLDLQTNSMFQGIWGNNLYVGGTGPASAEFFSNGRIVAIGQNGQVYVLDPYSNIGAWLGTQSEASQNVTGAADNGSGVIRLTVTAHGYRTGDWMNVASVGGVPNATGQWLIDVFDANHFDLLGSTFAGTYTTGGVVNRFFSGGAFETVAVAAGRRIENVVNNGSGVCRVTITAHGYKTGYAVVTTNVKGVPGANGNFLVTVIDANTFDLQGSTFSGVYVSGGVSINWPTAKLLAQGDGSLLLQNATINVSGPSGTIEIDPAVPQIIATDTNGDYSQMMPGAFNIVAGPGVAAGAEFIMGATSIVEFMPNGIGGNVAVAQLTYTPSVGAVLTLYDMGHTHTVSINPGVTNAQINTTDDINCGGVYRILGSPGITNGTRKMVTSVTTAVNGVFGTPGVGQSNGTVVTGVAVTTAAIAGGIVIS